MKNSVFYLLTNDWFYGILIVYDKQNNKRKIYYE